jgi:DNA polymerase, archaea type
LKHAGWILDLYHRPGHMVIWLKKTDGSYVRLTDPWKPKIHIGGNYRDLLDLACQPGLEKTIFVEKYEKARDCKKSRVLEIPVEGDQEAARIAKKLQLSGRYSKFRFYDVDVPSPQMYLYRKDLFPLAFVEAEETGSGLNWSLKDSRESIDYELPPLKKIGFQIGTQKTRKIRNFNDKLSTVQFIRDGEEILVLERGDEVDKILGLVEAFRVEDPDVVVTHGGDSFIFPYLARRAQELGILDRLVLGRDGSPLRVYEVQGHSYFSYGKILYRETAARLLGRLHVDQNNAYVSADCGLEGLFEVSRTCIMPIQRASRATIGTNMTSLQLYHAVKRDVLIPWNKNQPEELKNSGELVVADRGGFIYEPEIGIHDQVGELDFACLAKDSILATKTGRKCIADIEENDEVFTPFGWQRVLNVHKYKIKEKVFRLTLDDGKTLTCTARHKFPVIIRDSFKERKSNEIHRNSRLVVTDLLAFFPKDDLACIFGVFTAEGSSVRKDYQYFDRARNEQRTSHQNRISFTIGEQETEFRNFIVNSLSRIYSGIHFSVRSKKGERGLDISFSQKTIVNDFLSKYNSFIKNPHLTPDEKASFLRGFFEGDGSINIKRNTVQCSQSAVNTVKLEIVRKYLSELNIKNNVRTYKYESYSTKPTRFLELSGLEAHVRYYTQIGFISNRKEEKLRQVIHTRIRKAQHYNPPRLGVYLRAQKNNALSFLQEARVTNKEILDYDDYVYDISLEWEIFPFYFANGILTHNSLYPTIMTRMNLSGETVNCTCCPSSTNRVPELDFNICERSAGIVPLSLKILLDKRARYKQAKKAAKDKESRKLYDQRQSALKWILVCCLPSESPVLISQNGEIGYQQIGKVVDQQLGEDVGVFDCRQELFVAGVDKNLKSKFCRVSKLIKTPSPEKLLTVRMDDGRQVKCTANHSFYVLRSGRLVEINAENLSKGDLVPVAKRIVHNTTISRLDLLERVRQEIGLTESGLWRAKSDSLRAVVNSSSNTLQVVLKNEGRHVQNLEAWRESGIIPFRYLDLLSLPEQSSDITIGRGRRAGGHVAWLPASLDLDEDLGFFLGFYVADGSAGENFIRLDVGGNESEIVDHLTDIIKTKFGLTARLYKEPKANMFVLQVNSVSLVQILNRIFELPSSSATGKLKVPPFLFSSSQEAILGFISGLVAGDGSVNKDRDHISVATHSYDFAVQIGYLALHLGIPFNIIKGKRLHRIYFVGPNGLRPFKELFLKKKHRTRFETIRTSCHADCHHATLEMFPVEQSGLKEIATLTRTVRTPRLEGRVRVCPERARRSLQRIARNPHSSQLRESHSRIMKLLDSDIGFVAVKEIEQIESSSPFVYCFEISDDENFPAFFTGTGGVLVHNSFGYLGFKNARFGKIDAHIATCAFSREVLGHAAFLAGNRGFKLVHGIVDSFWLKKSGATRSEYEDLCRVIREELHLPISFEGLYKWIVFLSSKMDSKVGVLNRYYGIFEDGTLKVRGIDLRRHDTPDIVRNCQRDMLGVLSQAHDSDEFRRLIPTALEKLEYYVVQLREGEIRFDDLVIVRNLSKKPEEYSHDVPQAIAARHLIAQGGVVHAGQQVSYILAKDQKGSRAMTALPPEIVNADTVPDVDRYVDLLCSSAANLLLPFGYDTKHLRSMLNDTSKIRAPIKVPLAALSR